MTCVVIVEDERDLLSLVSDILEMEGFEVIPLSHPRQIETVDFPISECVMLFDLMLPDMDGITLAERVRSRFDNTVSIIAMSASREMLTRAEKSGLFDDTLGKPFHIDEIAEVVQRYAS